MGCRGVGFSMVLHVLAMVLHVFAYLHSSM